METIIEKTTDQIALEILKFRIKERVEKQKFYKDQRKAVHNKLPRTMDPQKAASEHSFYRHVLRLDYAAYGLLKGKTFSQIENKFPEENHPLNQWKREIEFTIDALRKAVDKNKTK